MIHASPCHPLILNDPQTHSIYFNTYFLTYEEIIYVTYLIISFSANCVLVGNISEKKDGQGNIIFDGEIKNIGGRRADFVKVDFVFRKNWSGETKTLTTFVKGSYNTFDTGIVSDASLLPGAVGKFDLYVPQDFGAFIGYSYVIDWEEYQ